MNICVVSREFPVGNLVGGIGTYSQAIAQILSQRGHQVHVLTYGDKESVFSENGYRVHRIPLLNYHLNPSPWLFHYRKWMRKKMPVYLNAITWARSVSQYFEQWTQSHVIDAVEYPETMGEGSLLKIPSGTRSICRIHSSGMAHVITNYFEMKAVLKLQRQACANADHVVSPSTYVIDHYAKNILKLPTSIHLSRNPLLGWKQPVAWENKSAFNLLYIGRIEFRKGLQTLISIYPALKEKFPQLSLSIVGACHKPLNQQDEELQKTFFMFLEEHKNTSVSYASSQPHDSLWKYYDKAGIVVLPSLIENYPYVAIEALSRGCYVVASNTGGIKEIVSSDMQGELFSPGNHLDLMDKLIFCLNTPEKWYRHKQKNAEEFQGKKSQDQWVKKFEQMVLVA